MGLTKQDLFYSYQPDNANVYGQEFQEKLKNQTILIETMFQWNGTTRSFLTEDHLFYLNYKMDTMPMLHQELSTYSLTSMLSSAGSIWRAINIIFATVIGAILYE